MGGLSGVGLRATRSFCDSGKTNREVMIQYSSPLAQKATTGPVPSGGQIIPGRGWKAVKTPCCKEKGSPLNTKTNTSENSDPGPTQPRKRL